VFPGLTVGENLRCAAWTNRRNKREVAAETARLLDVFGVLAERIDEPAANLSGGQQQMLGLAMSLLARPRLLMIDELSLGLAPIVVEQLAGNVRDVAADGTTIVLVEQSVNVALTLAETAYFMEKGEIRFSGPTAELLERPDLLRSVFLGGVTDEHGDTGGVAGDAPPTLETFGVWCSFGGIRAVDQVDLRLAPGEIVGLIGPNGAGKTTLLDVISGFAPLERGRVLLGGRDVGALSADGRARAGLGRSFQDARLFPSMTVTEALAVAMDRWVAVRDPINAVFRMPAAADSEDAVAMRVDELIELFGIGSFRDSFIGELSTGSRRVVDLAAGVAHSPSVLLLDEPSSGIAQREAEALAPLLLRIRDTLDASLIVIEHDMSLIASISDRLVALDQGRVVTIGAPGDVLAHPEVVASYLGGDRAVLSRSGPATGTGAPTEVP
jgi:branched-chain amino acid transport system ATP-binding protein